VDSFLITVSQGEMPMKSFLVALLAVVFLFPIYSFAQNNKYQWEKFKE